MLELHYPIIQFLIIVKDILHIYFLLIFKQLSDIAVGGFPAFYEHNRDSSSGLPVPFSGLRYRIHELNDIYMKG